VLCELNPIFRVVLDSIILGKPRSSQTGVNRPVLRLDSARAAKCLQLIALEKGQGARVTVRPDLLQGTLMRDSPKFRPKEQYVSDGCHCPQVLYPDFRGYHMDKPRC